VLFHREFERALPHPKLEAELHQLAVERWSGRDVIHEPAERLRDLGHSKWTARLSTRNACGLHLNAFHHAQHGSARVGQTTVQIEATIATALGAFFAARSIRGDIITPPSATGYV
jgi:hypothetical protein